MGDRSNIVIASQSTHGKRFKQILRPDTGCQPVVLYSHWGGTEMPTDLRDALALRQRWNDPAYLARIIFREMGAGKPGETGFGICAGELADNEYLIAVVDTEEQTVGFYRQSEDFPVVRFTIEQYIALTDEAIGKFYAPE